MKCVECKHYDFTTSICNVDTSEVDDIICLLRLIYWTLSDDEDNAKYIK